MSNKLIEILMIFIITFYNTYYKLNENIRYNKKNVIIIYLFVFSSMNILIITSKNYYYYLFYNY